MNKFQGISISRNFSIHIVEDTFRYEEDIAVEIEAIWQKEKQKEGRLLFNGTLLGCCRLEGESLFVQRIPYKAYFAQTLSQNVMQRLQLWPLSVSCITKCEERFLVGKRSMAVASHPGKYDLAPSGSLEEKALKDISVQVYDELKEETGIDASLVREISPFLFVKNSDEHALEICCRVALYPSALELGEYPKEEYEELFWLSKEEVLRHMEARRGEYVPLSLNLIQNYV